VPLDLGAVGDSPAAIDDFGAAAGVASTDIDLGLA
jgi:hypothetical protein